MRAYRILGGLTIFELLKSTARESWQDQVFGQSARLAFYYFLAIFPTLLFLLIPMAHLKNSGAEMRQILADSFQQILPGGTSGLVAGAIRDLDINARQHGFLLLFSAAGAVWAAVNAALAMIVGLNTAYEVRDDRPWHRIGAVAAGLASVVIAIVFVALAGTYYIGHALGMPGRHFDLLAQLARWVAIFLLLLISLGLFYRFGPNLKGEKSRWITPGAVFAAVLWALSALVFRAYFDTFGTYQQIYGRVASVAMLLMWLYVTSATVLIGAELNCEIAKARRPDAT
jgi:membrane protein